MSKTSLRWSAFELRQLILITIVFIAACIETDIYLPAFPDMMNYFHVSESVIQSILTWNFAGLCIAGLIYGPVSDAVGRRKPIIVALSLFLLGSIVTVFAHDFSWLLFGRVLQGLGSGGCFSLGSALIFDAFDEKKALKALNELNTVIPIIMAMAPLLGGFLNRSYGFRSNFIAILGAVFLSWLISLIFFDETLPVNQRQELNLKKLGKDFRKVLSSGPFWQMNLAVCLPFGGYLAFLSITSVLFVVEFQVSKTRYPFFQCAVLGGWLAASLSSTYVIANWSPQKAKKIGILIFGAGILGFLLTTWMAPRNPYWLTFFMMIYAFGLNWVQTPYFGEIMGLMPEIKGLLGSIVTSARLLLAAIVVGIAARYYDHNIYSLSSVLFGMMCIVGPMIWLRERSPKKKSAENLDPITVIH